jgi:sugar transferase (PEP-CTERM/EpsH1 system associated)
LIAHVVFRFDYGGLENGLINLINGIPGDRFRHCVIALTEATDFRNRLQKSEVTIHALGKRPGKDPAAYFRLYRVLLRTKPAILHTRNIGTLDCALFGRLAGVSNCIHGEHGWDTHDPDGTNPRYRKLRKVMNPLLRCFITVSSDLQRWLIDTVGIPAGKVMRICNGVDTKRFHPATDAERHAELSARFQDDAVIVGSVLRFNEIKDPMNLVEAFIIARKRAAKDGIRLCLAMLGDGPLRQGALVALNAAGVADAAWLPGSRDDVASIMRSFDLFVLGSRREGISNTLLEAMASGLPVIATKTGGNVELVRPGHVGTLVPVNDRAALAEAIHRYATDAGLRKTQGEAACKLARAEYSLDEMVNNYRHLYEEVIAGASG